MKRFTTIPQCLLALFILAPSLFAYDSVEGTGFVVNPTLTSRGIVFTDNFSSAIYLNTANTTLTLVSSPGCGNYFTVSPDGNFIGFKFIDEAGLQSPALLNLASGEITKLHAPVERAGQVSFTSDGCYAFTIGTVLHVLRGNKTSMYELGTYSNLAPISPDGNTVAFNDNNDQLWMMNLVSGTRSMVTDGARGYFDPRWAPNSSHLLYSSLNANLFVRDAASGKTYSLGEGFNPSWSHDAQYVIFYRSDVDKDKVINADIYREKFDGSETLQLTRTADVVEMDPKFGDDDTKMIYQTYNRKEICIASLADSAVNERHQIQLQQPVPAQVQDLRSMVELGKNTAIDMPYVNQVYDTPDWYNGHSACGPTSSIMVIAYYALLPKWDVWCSASGSSPGHYNSYGNYVCEKYRFKQIDYTYSASDPNGKASWGGYGFMWTGSYSPHSRMVNYYTFHGLSASLLDSPPFSLVVSEINAGYPYTLCNALTSAGHIIVLIGVDSAKHIVTVNDPYGNKNSGSYPSVNGKNVKYDWPSYNNGNQNLNTAWWGVTVRNTPVALADSVVDDLQFNNGFFMNNKAPATMYTWKDMNKGYKGHMWYAYTTYADSVDTCYAIWQPTLSKPGMYEVQAYIPATTTAATLAKYRVYYKGGMQTVVVNQKNYTDSSASLGTYEFNAGSTGYVRLGDATGIKNEVLIFDAIMWKYNGPTSVYAGLGPEIPKQFSLEQNYPNPFNPTTVISYQLPANSYVTLKVYDILGRELTTLVNEKQGAGTYSAQWDASGFSSGIYFYRLEANEKREIKKMVFVR